MAESLTPNAASPVRRIPTDTSAPPRPGLALCLSGGGYRAMLFHLGALWRLNELACLPKLTRISSVSGGSIAAGVLGHRWSRLRFVDGVATAFQEEVVAAIRTLAGRTIDVGDVLKGVFLRGPVNDVLVSVYKDMLFGDATLQDLPDSPRFVINATNVQSGVLWRFSKPYMWDWRVGKVERPTIELAVAVGASSAFPPVLSPARVHLHDSDFVSGTGDDLQRPPFTEEVFLTDGGVYDNLGLETAWKQFETILVSDGGASLVPDPEPHTDWLRHALRVIEVMQNQVCSLRKRQVIGSYQSGDRKGTYWGIGSQVADYHLADAWPCLPAHTEILAAYPTRLSAVPGIIQERLVNWGYAICDTAMRRHVLTDAARAVSLPYSDAGLGD
jgi:NTE family protein